MKHTIAITALATFGTLGAAHAGGLGTTEIEPTVDVVIEETALLTYGQFKFETTIFDEGSLTSLTGAMDLDFGRIEASIDGSTLKFGFGSETILTGKLAFEVVEGAALYVHGSKFAGETLKGFGADYQNDRFGISFQQNTINETDLNIFSGLFNINDNTTVFGSVTSVEDFNFQSIGGRFDNGSFGIAAATAWGEEFEYGFSSLAATYQIRPNIGLVASVQTTNDDWFDYGFFNLGAALNLNEHVAMEAHYAKGLSEFQEDSFGFALVVQTGDTRKRVIDQVIELNKSALGVSGVDFGTNGISQIEGPALGSLFLFGPV
ncbi:hypothetical protein XMM379_001860 [Aliiroseovarius sp. xm-m-379]|uniref:hypothetical protein n=1 Tax=unclassified Aliiroseovarius TaxID=2623558 RepID=UPI001568E529|nr:MULTISPECIES: hypothetical protein [unclassified Aliiroseovarius]NRP11945.1 hypothetical protein [Aliiroseovarius sp. xm-d-517]NRP25168.1 hypothetical protein [Aliiroseovarius sp. xm-m-379]NRP31100.1 hypothetical protein [Aliiroseovarius sp. xm-m-314]NRP33967.1 hypothetical protein [Aliiroseovarius sp. xm-a-104]NRP41561.1 hypothetical protein [Aliiroseovarius sp. xm-m-339-2]